MHLNREENFRNHVLFWGGWEITEPICMSMGRFHVPCIGGFWGDSSAHVQGVVIPKPRLGGGGMVVDKF